MAKPLVDLCLEIFFSGAMEIRLSPLAPPRSRFRHRRPKRTHRPRHRWGAQNLPTASSTMCGRLTQYLILVLTRSNEPPSPSSDCIFPTHLPLVPPLLLYHFHSQSYPPVAILGPSFNPNKPTISQISFCITYHHSSLWNSRLRYIRYRRRLVPAFDWYQVSRSGDQALRVRHPPPLRNPLTTPPVYISLDER